MEHGQSTKVETRRIRRLLQETAKLAKDASLTGSFSEGRRSAARQYNNILQLLERNGEIPGGLFQPLSEDANFDEVGVASAQLAGYLVEEAPPPPPVPPVPPSPPGVPHGGKNLFNVSIGNMPDLGELRGMGQKIREQVVEQILRERQHMMRQMHPDWFQDESTSNIALSDEVAPTAQAASLNEIESRMAEVGASLQAVAEQLRQPDLGHEERIGLSNELARLSQEQASLVQLYASLRQKKDDQKKDDHRTEKLS